MADHVHQELYAILRECWALLEQGARHPESRLHTMVLATTRPDGLPDARTVRLESVEAPLHRLRFNTDLRSPKIAELRALPQAVLVFFDGTTQIRARTTLTLHRGDAVARRSWEALPENQRIHYRTALPPGSPTSRNVVHHQSAPDASPDRGWENYVLVEAQVNCLDWLRIDDGAGRRAVFTRNEEGDTRGQWVVP